MKYFKHTKMLIMTAVIVGIMAMSSSMAIAGDATFEIDIQSAITSTVTVVFAALGVVATWVAHKFYAVFQEKTGMEIEDSMRAYIDVAVINGLNYAKSKVLDETKNIKSPEVESEFIATAAGYVLNKVPEALKYFDLDNNLRVEELILARLPQIKTT